MQVELCGATAKAHGWGNADLIPGIKINTDAMARDNTTCSGGFRKLEVLAEDMRVKGQLISKKSMDMAQLVPSNYRQCDR